MKYNSLFTYAIAVLAAVSTAAPMPDNSAPSDENSVVTVAPVADFNDMVKISAESLVNPPVDLNKATKDSAPGMVDQLISNVEQFTNAAKVAQVSATTLNRVIQPYVQYVQGQIQALAKVDPGYSSQNLTSAVSSLTSLETQAHAVMLLARDDTSATATATSGSTGSTNTNPFNAFVTVDTDGMKLFKPVQAVTHNLLTGSGAASTLYKGIDQLDQVVDGTASFLSNALSVPTLGVSKVVGDFLTGPIVQSINHGLFATISTVLGAPVDGIVSDLAPAASSLSSSVSNFISQMNNYNVDTSATQQANQLLQQRLQQINPSLTFN